MRRVISFRRSVSTLVILGVALVLGLAGSYAQEPIPPVGDLTLPDSAATPKLIPTKISFSGTGLITMYDPCTGQTVPKPEWDRFAGRNDPAAYSRAADRHITVSVKFRRLDPSVTQAWVAAWGAFGGFPFQSVTFSSDESDWVTFTSREAAPDAIQVHDAAWLWGAKTPDDPWAWISVTQHRVYTTNEAPLTSRVYRELVEWTTEWCQGLPDDDKQIADAILDGFASTGVIKYGGPGWDTAEILCTGDGMCGGMYQVFYDATATQGVHVARSCYILKDADPGSEYQWNSMIIFSYGLGRTEHPWSAQTIREVNDPACYPCPEYLGTGSPDDCVDVETRRAYEFFAPGDGHCINLLEYDGQIYLYDLSFGTGPWPNTWTSLPYGTKQGAELHDFRVNYMNTALDYMRGRITYDSGTGACTALGTLDVDSDIIPDDISGQPEMRYDWSTTP
jgi:hypothetical protein